ncbi:MAG: site-specific DNA-methyltransferase [Firmicutes bacterium]|nr:site-specific DNA-methyltransferase [Bacillota bacterium]MCL5040107.1 site-specific DNA-methyltransferase [Bacillota bacterium]
MAYRLARDQKGPFQGVRLQWSGKEEKPDIVPLRLELVKVVTPPCEPKEKEHPVTTLSSGQGTRDYEETVPFPLEPEGREEVQASRQATPAALRRPACDQPEFLSWRDRLIQGENGRVMTALLPELRGKVDLIYLDPPFNSGYDFLLPPEAEGHNGQAPSGTGARAYRDSWGKDLAPYLAFLYHRLVLMRELLADDGSLYLHVDWHAGHYLKLLLDEIFGRENFRNEIIWKRDIAGKGAKKGSGQWPRNFDTLFFYSKSLCYHFVQPYRPLSEKQKGAYRHREPDGRRFKAVQLGDYSQESVDRLMTAGLIYTSSTGRRYKKYYLDEAQATVDAIWDDIPGFGTRTAAREFLNFPKQKPEALLRRIIEASSREGDLVADFFSGSGTTLVVAGKLGRRWIGVEENPRAVEIARKRLEGTAGQPPFEVWAAPSRQV